VGKPRSAPEPLDRWQVLWLTLALVMPGVPHVARVPVWVSGLLTLAALWRVAVALGRAVIPGTLTRFALGAALIAGVVASYGTVLGRGPGVALLLGFGALKLLETRSRRDGFVVVLVACFLALSAVLFSQDIPTGAYLGACLLAAVTAQVALTAPSGILPPRRHLALAGALLAQGIPIALALFLLFPRLPGPLWSLPRDPHAASSGLDDTMSPGHITRLGLSDEIAFRARFAEAPPAPAELYWRGPVLWSTDGRTWSAGEPGALPPPPVEAQTPPVRYAVTLEPHGRRWLFALDAPVDLPRGATLRPDYQVLAATPVRQRMRYEASSVTRYRMVALDDAQRRHALALPEGRHPRAVALARGWRGAGLRPQALVDQVLRHFREEPFVYTLYPAALPGDPVDEFLFETRRGFCEHYAAAFTVLMRAAGVPARVVTGYQGGEVNPLDGYLVVRQRDAHAWAEVWLEGRGWLRVDPTAAVAPSRVERGLEAAIPSAGAPFAGFLLDEDSRLARALRSVRHGWDAAGNWWNQWVLGFEARRQREVLARLGIDAADWRRLASALLVLVGGPLLVVAWLLHRTRGPAPDPARRLYERFCRRLARVGVPRVPTEAPLAYARRAGAALPAAAAAIDAVTAAYTRVRYAGEGDGVAHLRHLVRAFRPTAGTGKTRRGHFG